MKRWKKIVILIFSFNLMFFAVDSSKREGDASVAAFTLAGATVLGLPLMPVIAGVVGLTALGVTIYNWETVSSYGDAVIDRLINAGVDPASVINTENGTMQLNPSVSNAMSGAVDDVPGVSWPAGLVGVSIPSIISRSYKGSGGYEIRDKVVISVSIPVVAHKQYHVVGNLSTFYEHTTYPNYLLATLSDGSTTQSDVIKKNDLSSYRFIPNVSGEIVSIELKSGYTYGHVNDFVGTNLKVIDSTTYSSVLSGVDNAGALTDVSADAQERNQTIINNFGDTVSVAIPQDYDFAGADWAGLVSASDSVNVPPADKTDVGGWFGTVWQAIKNLPSAIAAAFAALFMGLQDFLSQLWEDAGLVWTGMAENINLAKGALDQILAGIMENVSGGIDKLRIGVDGLLAKLSAGIDSISGVLDGWGASLRDGIDSLAGGLTTAWGNILAGLGTFTDSIVTGITDAVGALTGSLTGILDRIAAIPLELYHLVVPKDWTGIDTKLQELTMRENPFKSFIESITSVFDNRKSIFDIRVTYYGKLYPLVPISLKPALDNARNFFTGSLMLVTLTIFYVKAKGISWWK